MKLSKMCLLLLLISLVCGCSDSDSDDHGDHGSQTDDDSGKKDDDSGKKDDDSGKKDDDSGKKDDDSGKTVIDRTTCTCCPEENKDYPDLYTDEDWARALIAGKVSVDLAFPAIAYSCGFPVMTDDNTILFLHWFKGQSWSVAGDLNNWEKSPMQVTADENVWYGELAKPAEPEKANAYKFVKNGTEYQSDPWALRFDYDEQGEKSLIVSPSHAQYLMRWNMFKSPQGLKERAIYALVPPNNGPYDVIYAHDGQNLFASNGYSGGWKLRENMTKINGDFLIVGIENTEDRMVEYTHVDDTAFSTFYHARGDDYAKFVEESVRTFIEKRFKTTSKAGVMGSSLGGLISLYIAHLYPGRYRAVLALSPTTAWGRFGSDNGTTIRDLYVQDGHRTGIWLYLDNGGYEPSGGCPETLGMNDANIDESDGASSHDNYCYTYDFVHAMEGIGYQHDVDLNHWHEPGALHNEEAWAARVFRPLETFMKLDDVGNEQ